jgi:hypothetical protein
MILWLSFAFGGLLLESSRTAPHNGNRKGKPNWLMVIFLTITPFIPLIVHAISFI